MSTLTLDITDPSSDRRIQHTFAEDGGTIGRAPGPGNSCVLMNKNVSRQHVVITFHNGAYYFEDTSQNGVCLNSPQNRIPSRRPYPIKAGDRLFIEPYVIDVSMDDDVSARPGQTFDPFAEKDRQAPPRGFSNSILPNNPSELINSEAVDPLEFFPPSPQRVPAVSPSPAPTPLADDFLGSHYQPPEASAPRLESEPAAMPVNYNPVTDDSGPIRGPLRPWSDDAVLLRSDRYSAPPEPPPARAPVLPPPVVRPAAPVAPKIDPEPPAVRPSPQPRVPDVSGVGSPSSEFLEILKGAGLQGAPVTLELTRNFGQILRVVVAGVMDVLQARARIKEEFRMRQTTFRLADNNPLKFSANVDDALHNLLVKRNPAYLGAVDAFADAFDDLRHHQLAMLAGMRVAFEAMLAEFDPDQLQEEFDKQLSKGGLALVPSKLRYWDLFREKRREMLKDADATFSRLFGEEFAKAYEEQFRRLKAERQTREPNRQ